MVHSSNWGSFDRIGSISSKQMATAKRLPQAVVSGLTECVHKLFNFHCAG